LRTLKGHSAEVVSVAFSSDGKTLASGRFDHTIKLWDVASGGECVRLKDIPISSSRGQTEENSFHHCLHFPSSEVVSISPCSSSAQYLMKAVQAGCFEVSVVLTGLRDIATLLLTVFSFLIKVISNEYASLRAS
jgi:WD40 repeat protein